MLRNIKFEPIEDKKMEEVINQASTEVFDYLTRITSPENKKILQERLQHMDTVIMEAGKLNTHKEINGELVNFKVPSFASAVASAGKIVTIDTEMTSDYYIYLREGSPTLIIKHEMMHALSAARKLEKIDDNTYVVNFGLDRSYELAARGEKLLRDNSIYKDGKFINEGMTDYLAVLSEGMGIEDATYLDNVLLAQFLVGGNIENRNNLIQAYVSDTIKDNESFENDFDSHMKDEGLTYKDYAQFKDPKDIEKYTKLLKGAVSYRIKSSKTLEERNNEVSFYTNLLTDMKDNKALNQELSFRFDKKLGTMILELQEHLDGLTVENELDNNFYLTTQSIGNATIHSPTELKREVENIETEQQNKDKTNKEQKIELKTAEEEQDL